MTPSSLLLAALFALPVVAFAQPSTHAGALGPGDDRLAAGEYYDRYELAVQAGQTIEADLTSSAFDTYLLLVAPSGGQEENDDYEGSQQRSHLRVRAQESGTYLVVVTSYGAGETGDYRLTTSVSGGGAAPPPPSGGAPGSSASGSRAGLIAYARVVGATETRAGTVELHTVAPDGSGDRVVWSGNRGLVTAWPGVQWRPDGREIAFTSAHEFDCSPYDNDVFAVRPDGSGLRRITHPPLCAELAGRPQGAVTVTVTNHIANTFPTFYVYVEGARAVAEVTVQPRGTRTVTIPNVADLGREQMVYVKGGAGTWQNPAVYADVRAGGTAQATTGFDIANGYGPFQMKIGAFSWSPNGREIAYHTESGITAVMNAEPAVGEHAQLLFPSEGASPVATGLSWSPSGDEFLYYTNLTGRDGIYRARRGSDPRAHTLVLPTDAFVGGISWLPGGSGFLYSLHYFGLQEDEVWRYDFGAGRPSRVASGPTLGTPMAAPDGRHFLFVKRTREDEPYTLWGATLDGREQWPIARDVVAYAWGPGR